MICKEYEKVASIFYKRISTVSLWGDEGRTSAMKVLHRTIVEFADWFEEENPRFDRPKFLHACGLKPRLEGQID